MVIESEVMMKKQKVEESEREKEEGIGINHEGGGILDSLMSKLSSPTTPKPIDVEVFDGNTPVDELPGGGGGDGGADGGSGNGGGDVDGGGGVLNNLISCFFHQDEGEFGEKKETLEEGEVANKDEQKSEGQSIVYGNIISNLVPDDLAPASDEASILIHSVVHD